MAGPARPTRVYFAIRSWRSDRPWRFGQMTTKTFDSVKLMRELRDKLSQEMEHMTAEERLRYIRARRRRLAWEERWPRTSGTPPNNRRERSGSTPVAQPDRSADTW